MKSTSAGSLVLIRIRSAYPGLSRTEKKIADHVLKDPEGTIYASITELAEYCGVGEASIIRFCHTIGFRGFQEFKLVLAQELGNLQEEVATDISPSDDIETLARKVAVGSTQSITDTLGILDLRELERAMDAIANARRVVFFGVGASGFTALDAKYKFLRIGVQCDAFTDSHLQAMSAATLQSGDVVVGISQTGSTKDVVDSCRIARSSGAQVICITAYIKAPITRVADIILLTAVQESPLGSGAIRSKVAQLYLLDLLFTGVAVRNRDKARHMTQKTAEAVLDKLY